MSFATNNNDSVSLMVGSVSWFVFFQVSIVIGNKLSHLLWPQTFRTMKASEQAYWTCSMISTFHAMLICSYGLGCALDVGFLSMDTSQFSVDDLLHKTSACSHRTIHIFLGYISADLTWLLYYCKEWPGSTAMIFHHILAISTYADIGIQQVGHNVAISIVLLEITTPFVNCRWFLSKMGEPKDSRLYIANGLVITAGWFFVRILHGAYIGYMLWVMREPLQQVSAYTRFVTFYANYILGYGLQWFWFIKIARGAMKTLTGGGKKDKKSK